MKKIITLILTIMSLTLSIAPTVRAEAIFSDGQGAGFYIQFFIPVNLDGNTLIMVFKEVNTGETKVLSTNEYKENDLQAYLPFGTWELSEAMFLENNMDGYEAYLLPGEETFIVSKDGVNTEDGTISLFIQKTDLTTTDVPVSVDTEIVVNSEIAYGKVQLLLYGDLDALYTHSDKHRQYARLITIDGNSTISLETGNWSIVAACAYDKEGNPLGVIYNQNPVKIQAYDNSQIEVIVFSDLNDLSSVQRDMISTESNNPSEDKNYVIKNPSDMPAYNEYKDALYMLSMDDEKAMYNSRLDVMNNGFEYDEDKNSQLKHDISYDKPIVETNETTAQPVEENTNHSNLGIVVFVSVIAVAVVGFIIYSKKKNN